MYSVLALTPFVLAFIRYLAFLPNSGPFSVLAIAMDISSLTELVLPYIARRKKWADLGIWELHKSIRH